jgi:hypothetical protein
MSGQSSPRLYSGDGINPKTDSYWLPPWIYPPAEFEPIDDVEYVALPAIGTSAVVLERIVDPGYNGMIQAIANNFVGGGWSEGSGDVTWQIVINGAPLPGYDSILASLGSPANPVRHPSGFRIQEGQKIQLIVFNNAVVLAGQLSGGRWQGYLYPKEYEDPNYGGQ